MSKRIYERKFDGREKETGSNIPRMKELRGKRKIQREREQEGMQEREQDRVQTRELIMVHGV